MSESGRALKHERSLMERLLVNLRYDNVVTLVEQHRMAPELLAFPNARFYDGALRCAHAPPSGAFEVRVLSEGREEACGSSTLNRAEAACARDIAAACHPPLLRPVLVSPYAAQCRLLLAQGTGCEVHTVDSFQGREADFVVLSLVRDGTHGFGFWEDARRLVVALTRARRRLVVLASNADAWPDDAPLTALVAAGREAAG